MKKNTTHLSKEESGQVNITKLIKTSLHHWYYFVFGVLICLAISYLYLQYTTPVYYISSTFLVKDDKKGPDLNGNAVFSELNLFKSTNNIDNEVEILKSQTLMQRVLTELSMETSYFVEGQIRNHEIYNKELPVRAVIAELNPIAYEKWLTIRLKDNYFFELEEVDENDSLIVNTYRFGDKIEKPYGVFSIVKGENLEAYVNAGNDIFITFNDIETLATYYNEQLYIAPVSKTASVLTLGLLDPVPERGRDIINKLVEVYNREEIEDKNQIASNTITFLDERLQFITEELTNVEKNVEKYKRQNEVANVSLQAQSYVDNASEYRKQLTDWSIQIEMLESLEGYIQRQGADYELVPSTIGIKDPSLQGMISKFNEMQLERERMLRTMHPGNPLVQNIDAQLDNLRKNVLENLRNIKNDLIITKNSLQASSGQYAEKIQNVPSIERHLLEINRQQGIKEALYLYLLQKREESALALSATVSNIRIIDPAIVGKEPASPKKPIILLVAMMVGLGFPLGFFYVKDVLNDKVQERKDVELLTGTPILGEIAQKKSKKTLVVTESSKTPVAELFRLARINLNFSTVGKENKVIMITSSMSGEGKTFFTINLGASIALSGKKVCIVDLDLRKPRVLADLGFVNDKGVTDYIISPTVSLDEIVKPIEPNLFVIGTGPIPPNPGEFMLSPKLGKLISDLKDNFDHVIIDTAPIGQVSDAFVLAPLIDTTVYMVRHNYTYKEQLEIINEIYTEKKLRNPMIVLNDTKKQNGYRYGYAYGMTTKNKAPRKRMSYFS